MTRTEVTAELSKIFDVVQQRREGHWRVLRVFPGVMDVPSAEYGDLYQRELQKIEAELAVYGLVRTKHSCIWGEFVVTARGDPKLYSSD